jgi:hypothetical protein
MDLTKRLGGLIAAAVPAASGLIGMGVATAPPASANDCYFTNLTSYGVTNIDCKHGAYAYWDNAWIRHSDWAGPGGYSANWSSICYRYIWMVKK